MLDNFCKTNFGGKDLYLGRYIGMECSFDYADTSYVYRTCLYTHNNIAYTHLVRVGPPYEEDSVIFDKQYYFPLDSINAEKEIMRLLALDLIR